MGFAGWRGCKRNADNQCCGQTYIDMYLLDKRQHPERVRDIKASIDSMMQTSKIDDWSWVDAIQMACRCL
jgi:Glycosyl Hydrolase Family 88.